MFQAGVNLINTSCESPLTFVLFYGRHPLTLYLLEVIPGAIFRSPVVPLEGGRERGRDRSVVIYLEKAMMLLNGVIEMKFISFLIFLNDVMHLHTSKSGADVNKLLPALLPGIDASAVFWRCWCRLHVDVSDWSACSCCRAHCAIIPVAPCSALHGTYAWLYNCTMRIQQFNIDKIIIIFPLHTRTHAHTHTHTLRASL